MLHLVEPPLYQHSGATQDTMAPTLCHIHRAATQYASSNAKLRYKLGSRRSRCRLQVCKPVPIPFYPWRPHSHQNLRPPSGVFMPLEGRGRVELKFSAANVPWVSMGVYGNNRRHNGSTRPCHEDSIADLQYVAIPIAHARRAALRACVSAPGQIALSLALLPSAPRACK